MKKILLVISALAVQLTVMAATWTLNGTSYTVTTTSTSDLGAGTVVTKATVKSGSHVMRIFYSVTDLTNPNVEVRTMTAGTKLSTRNTVPNIAKRFTDCTPLVGVNGGFFTTGSTGTPGGLTVVNGNACKGFSGDGYSTITFDDNNAPTIGYLNSMGCWCSIGSSTTEGWTSYAAINTSSSVATNAGVGEQLIFFTPESNNSTSNTSGAGGYAVQLTPVNGNKFSLGKYLSYKVASAPSSGNVTIPSNGIVMFGKGTQNGAYVKGLKSGDVITVYLTPNIKDNAGNITKPEITQALGGSMMILDGGTRISSYSNSLGNISGNEPRTAVGYNADKTKFVMLVVDGRNSGYSNGCNGKVLGDIMKNLGCSDAINFDGGGSSTFWTSNSGVINDTYNNNSGSGQIRSVADGLFIVKVAAPAISTSVSSIALTTTNNAEVSKSITVSGSNLRGDIKIVLEGTNANQFNISSSSISQSVASGTITIKYKPTTFGSHSAKLTITSDAATTKTVTISGTNTEVTEVPDEEEFDDRIGNMTEVWNYSGNTTQPSWLDITDGSSSGTTTRFIAENGGMLYVLNCKPYDTPTINILNAYTGVDTGNDVNLTGVSGGLTALSSIRFVDNVLVGANAVSTSNTFTVYAWKNGVASAPTKILEDATHGSLIMGSNIAISGNLTNGRIWATDDGCKNVFYYTISNGTVNTTPTIIALKDASGNQLELKGSRGAAEVLPNTDGTFWVIGQSTYPYLFNASGTFVKSMNAGALNNNPYGTALKFFNYGKKQYSAAIAYTSGQKNGYFTLSNTTNGIDITVGYNCRYPVNGLGENANAQNMSSIAQSTRNNGKILDIWICCALQGVAHYSHNAGGEQVGVEEMTTIPEATFVVNGSNLLATGIEVKEFSLYSINGAVVRTAQNSHRLDVEGLNGLYIAVAVEPNGAIHTSKVVIR